MSFLSDGDSSSSDPCTEDQNASQQRRELVEVAIVHTYFYVYSMNFIGG
jgi:hypothetical protein